MSSTLGDYAEESRSTFIKHAIALEDFSKRTAEERQSPGRFQ